MKETSKFRFLTRREQGRTGGHSVVKSEKFQQKKGLFVLIHMFAIFQNTSVLRVIESNTFWRKGRN